MVTHPFDVIGCFLFHILQKSGIARKHGTGKHEVLPNQNSVFVAQIVKPVVFVNSTTPNAQHVEIGDFGGMNHFLVHFVGYPGSKNIVWNVVGAFHKYRNAV